MLKSISAILKKLVAVEKIKSVRAPVYHGFPAAEIAELERLAKSNLANEVTNGPSISSPQQCTKDFFSTILNTRFDL